LEAPWSARYLALAFWLKKATACLPGRAVKLMAQRSSPAAVLGNVKVVDGLPAGQVARAWSRSEKPFAARLAHTSRTGCAVVLGAPSAASMVTTTVVPETLKVNGALMALAVAVAVGVVLLVPHPTSARAATSTRRQNGVNRLDGLVR